ncbi:MAG TPA: M15 family metallopeptidase, partial [Chitinophagaceae bacterium]|nr:M15 family metallopeptidase [Chitinophagaceae bacterium]
MNKKYYIFFLLCFIISCKSNKQIFSKNEYGLIVLTTPKQYFSTVSLDSSKLLKRLNGFIPNIVFDWRYATTNNFTKQILYTNPDAYLRIEAANNLKNVAIELEKIGLGIKVFDAYRPYSVTKKMWEVVPDDRYASDPAKGSGHNRGIAIDLTLYNLETGTELEMPTSYDNFTENAHANYQQLSQIVLKNRTILINTMQMFGFKVLDTEWWHFYLPNSSKYELMDYDFKTMSKM